MRYRTLTAMFVSVAALLVFGVGCAQTISREELATKVEKADQRPFSDQFLYEGDNDGYHYVRHRSIYSCWSFLGDSDYRISTADWAIAHPFPLTGNPRYWRNVTWMDDDTRGIPQNPFVYATPSFPEGAPATAPAIRREPATQEMPETLPATQETPNTLPATQSQPAAPATQPAAPDTGPGPRL
jgi:hypothetical protein